jgi:cytochrome c-type biogenesis protein CcmH/NrfG
MARPPWREWINKGVQMLQDGRSSGAIFAVDKASDLNPKSAVPQLYLALGWTQLYVPGDSSSENVGRSRVAEAALRRALELEPGNRSSFVLPGMLARNENRLEDAYEWYRRALREGRGNADTRCTLGEIGFHLWLRHGKPADELEQLIREFQKSVELDPAHEAGMRYLSVMFRERAAMRQNSEEARKDLTAAQSWQERAVDVHAESIQSSIAQRVPHPLEADHPDSYLNFVVSMALKPVPPPVPLPIPPHGAVTAAHTVGEATIVFERIVEGAPRPIRVPSAVQAEKIITKVEPQVAAYAQPENPLRFVIVIGKDGHIVKEIFIDGNPWLRQTAVAALRQWMYEPTLAASIASGVALSC